MRPAQQASQTAPSSGRGVVPPQAAQGGAKIRASARLTMARSVTRDAARDYSGVSSSMVSCLAVPHSRSSP